MSDSSVGTKREESIPNIDRTYMDGTVKGVPQCVLNLTLCPFTRKFSSGESDVIHNLLNLAVCRHL